MAQVDPPQVAPGGHTAVFTVVPTSSPDDASTEALVHELRDTVFPASPGSPQAHVGGATTTSIDLANQLGSRMGWFMRVVVGLAFLLLLVEFRALLVPAMAVGLNLLAVGAAYGPVVAVFQWDWGHLSLLGSEPGPIESFAPVMLFAVLFGLSTDYAIFLLSRVREGFQHTGDVRRAMREGIVATGRVILAARRSWWSSSPASCSTTSGWSTCSASAWRWRCTRRRCSFWSPRCCRSWAVPPGGPPRTLSRLLPGTHPEPQQAPSEPGGQAGTEPVPSVPS